MKTMEMNLIKEMEDLKKIIELTERRFNRNTAKGSLRIVNKNGNVEYYLKNDDDGSDSVNGRYMKKSENILAINIAQKDYDAKVLKNAKERLKAIELFLKK